MTLPREWTTEDADRESLEASQPEDESVIILLNQRCPLCGYEFSHPAWNADMGKVCPSCGAVVGGVEP